MKTVKEVDQIFYSFHLESLDGEQLVPVGDAHGSLLKQDIFAKRSSPPFHRVAMDGIALSLSKTNRLDSQYKICGVLAAGDSQISLISDSGCIEVMTGAVLPLGCDTVVPYEHIEINSGLARIKEKLVKLGDNVHREGADYIKGDLLLSKGELLNSTKIALIVSEGISEVVVAPKIKMAIVATGSELVMPGFSAMPHQIYASNLYALKNEIEAHGHIVTETRLIQDDEIVLKQQLASIIDSNDLIVLSGGVSKGKFDFVPNILAAIGVEKIFHQVKQKPGKPLFVGLYQNRKVIVGLPGNPVSSLVNLRRYVIPLLARYQGRENTKIFLKLGEDVSSKNDFTLFLPVMNSLQEALIIKNNGSGDFYSLTKSAGFVELNFTQDKQVFLKGEMVAFYEWGR